MTSPTSALGASEAFDESRYRSIRLDPNGTERLGVKRASVTAMQASHQHDKIGGPHDQSSSASCRTAGAAGFFTFSQCADRPDLYGEPSRFDTMPSQPSAQASR